MTRRPGRTASTILGLAIGTILGLAIGLSLLLGAADPAGAQPASAPDVDGAADSAGPGGRDAPGWTPIETIRAAPGAPVRDVTGGRLLRVAPHVDREDSAGTGAPALRRLPSRVRISPALPKTASSTEAERFHRVVVEDPGHFSAGAHRIALAGVRAPTARTHCTGTGGAVWPCGRHAVAAVRKFVRTRALDCAAPVEAALTDASDNAASDGARSGAGRICQVGGTVLNAWVVAQGWAVPTDDAQGRRWQGLHAMALREGRGIYRDLGRGDSSERSVARQSVLIAE